MGVDGCEGLWVAAGEGGRQHRLSYDTSTVVSSDE